MKDKAMLKLNWIRQGSERWGANPELPFYRCELGKDPSGILWLCEAKYLPRRQSFLVRFDTETYEDGSPFLRHSILDEDIPMSKYWKMHDEYYRAAYVRYEQIQDIIRKFIVDHSIEAYDVCNKKVVN